MPFSLHSHFAMRRHISERLREHGSEFDELAYATLGACRACGGPTVTATDRKTGKPVRDRGRAMVRCQVCKHIDIIDDPVRASRKAKFVVLTLDVAAGIWTAGLIIVELARAAMRGVKHDEIAMLGAICGMMAFGALWALHVQLLALAMVIGRRFDRETLEMVIVAFFWLIGGGLCGWVFLHALSELRASGATPTP